jgi:uncharacterized protein YggT (Ycf19 family)
MSNAPLPPQPYAGQPAQPGQPVPPAGQPEPAEPPGPDAKIWLVRVAKAVVFFVYLVVIIDLVLLTLGFFLRLFGASTDAEFTQWVYRNVDRVMEPFRGIFPSHAVSEQSILDTSLLFAMIVYSIVGIALHALVTWLTEKLTILRRRQQASLRRAQQPDPMAGSGRRYA